MRSSRGKETNKKPLISGSAYHIVVLLGVLFCLVYLNRATLDVVRADYFRLAKSYLPDVWNPRKFFVPDILTRIPLNYLTRGLNVSLFGFNTVFDMVLGVFGLGASALVLGRYCKRERLPARWFGAVGIVLFSLNKWEMLTNGTAWIHALAFACFYYHYLVLDRALVKQKAKTHDHARLLVLPWLITLGVAGPYCAIYSLVLILAYGYLWLKDQNHLYLLYGVSVVGPLVLYIISNAMAEPDVIGSTQDSFFTGFFKAPLYFVKFFLASFGSMIMGNEAAAEYYKQTESLKLIYLFGLIVIIAYLAAIWFNVIYGIYKDTLLPLILLASGLLNHLLILYSRWRFENVFYGMSSRYALQFQAGIIGILLTIALIFKYQKRSWGVKIASLLFCALILAGNVYTTYGEWQMAPHRKDYQVRLRNTALNYREATDEDLLDFEYYRSLEVVREVLEMLEENKLNVFRK